jgi:hypothetical protein
LSVLTTRLDENAVPPLFVPPWRRVSFGNSRGRNLSCAISLIHGYGIQTAGLAMLRGIVLSFGK